MSAQLILPVDKNYIAMYMTDLYGFVLSQALLNKEDALKKELSSALEVYNYFCAELSVNHSIGRAGSLLETEEMLVISFGTFLEAFIKGLNPNHEKSILLSVGDAIEALKDIMERLDRKVS